LDNTTLIQKCALRRRYLRFIDDPIVIETHGGFGEVWRRVYSGIDVGCVIERDEDKAEALAKQRPTWRVVLGDCEKLIRHGLYADAQWSVLDIDPYGEPWQVIDAFFSGSRNYARRMILVVNDGLRQKLRVGGGWLTGSMKPYANKYGNIVLFDRYLDICRDKVVDIAARVGYRIVEWTAYHCGTKGDMTHYAALLTL